MKPFHIAIGIAGVSLLFVGAIAIRSKLEYDKDGRVITRLIAEYKAMGVPTNSEEFFHPIPDAENAWVEIGPILLDKNGKGNGPLFRSGLASDFIYSANKQDLPLIRKYLRFNQAKREAIVAALKAKPDMQVPHNYNEGMFMLLPEYAVMKTVAREFCLAAYADGLEGNMDGFRQNLDIANRFANHCLGRGEQIGSLVGTMIRREIMGVSFRLAESSPSLIPEIHAYMKTPKLMQISDPKKVLQGEFVMQLGSGRILDSPAADRRPPPWPLNKVIKSPESSEIESKAKVRPGDYMPESHAMRSFLRKRLQSWKPVITELMSKPQFTSMPSKPLFDKVINMYHDFPPAFSSYDVLGIGDQDVYEGFNLDRQTVDANLNLWRAIEIKSKTGKYPSSLSELGIPIRSITGNKAFALTADKNGLLIESVEISKETGKPVLRRSFPVSRIADPGNMASRAKKLLEYRQGKIDESGSPISSSRRGPAPGGPPAGP